MEALKPYAGNLMTMPDCDGNTQAMRLEKLGQEISKAVFIFFQLTLGSIESNDSVTYSCRNILLWSTIASKAL